MSRRLICLSLAITLLLVGSLFLASASPAGKPHHPFVAIGAWNIQWLGNPEMRPGKLKGLAQKPEDLADYILQSKVDILALEEVSDNDGDPDSHTNKTIATVQKILDEQTKQSWKHMLMPSPAAPDKDTRQLCGVLWNTGKVSQVGNIFQIPVPVATQESEIWKRHPHGIMFSFGKGKTDIVLIPVHMKSNRNGVPFGRKRRTIEAKTLMQKIDVLQDHFQDKDIVILGDTNIMKNTEPAVNIFKAFGFKDLNSPDDATHASGAPFDRFFVPDDQPEFLGSTQDVFDEAYLSKNCIVRADFVRRFSDHFMVTMKVKVLADDD